MKKLCSFVFICFLFKSNYAQVLSLRELTDLLELSPAKLESHLNKKGFARTSLTTQTIAPVFTRVPKLKQKDSTRRQLTTEYFQVSRDAIRTESVYETTSQDGYLALEKELQLAGFRYQPLSDSNKVLLFQKQNLSFERYDKKIDSVQYYGLKICLSKMPKPNDVFYLEDLYPFNSHELLTALCGKQHVKADVFHFSQGISRKCSIIFPNTDRQAIILWQDEVNLRGIYSIIIGEQNVSTNGNNSVALCTWHSKQGLYCGMSLKDVEVINKEPFNFYNWGTERAGVLIANESKGALNFDKARMVFGCMNCHFMYVDNNVDVISSAYSIRQNQRVYVSTIIIFP